MVANIGMGLGDADTISLIDMRAKPLRVVNTVTVPQTPEGLKMSPDGAYVAVTAMNGSNKPANSPFFNDFGLLKIFRINGTEMTPVAEARIGHWCQGIAWSKDSKTILAQCMVENEIATFTFDGKTLTKGAPIAMKVDPADPTKAVPDDKLTVIDLKSSPPKVLATLQAGLGAAGVSINRAATLALVANRSEDRKSVV